MRSREYTFGTTLIEMVIVIAVIALLVSMVIGITSHIDKRSKEKGLNNIFTLLGSALQEYYEYTDKFPEQPEKNFTNAAVHSELLLTELRSIPNSRKVLEQISDLFLKNKAGANDTSPEIYDPWGTVLDYRYVQGDTFPELISAGPDKVFDTTDDISSKK
jgi:type II secretory pathway pseudopilin PulG